MARAFTSRRVAFVATAGVLALGLAACGGSSDSTTSSSAAPESSAAPAPGEPVKVTLITKDSTNPFFVAMQEGAKEAAAAQGVDLTVGSGKAEGDDQGQIDLIEQAIARGDAGILITPISTNVNAAIEKARAAGLYVIALDTPTDPPETVDITFATDNCLAGQAIGQWTAGWLNGEKATIARLVIFNDRMVSVDYCRDNGFLEGLGVDVVDPTVMGDEAESGTYTTGAGGDYEWVCLEATGANQEGGRAGMEKCLAANPDINVVYTINEPTAFGAAEALKAAGKTIGTDVIIVSVDGGLAGVEAVKAGEIQATSQQYPLLMASLGVEAIATIANGGAPPQNTSANGQFFDTGVKLCTEDPQDTVTAAEQWTAQQCIDNAWG
ncbi:MAG: substrate-binding domain-containing protein [Candidatus Nanopelagicales bacterium]|jgi:fructose transport system substrate-binding protein|nr:substrate-binding domain-containing protein [Candidatus Nanopelagicales bacterium]MDP4714244.1 substrate-binding domain-containing protein [Candidatus Nanopelagicales bacterium]MDP4905670.1 substrate-binding domain-containing protein [Candidatus Nanopelagicales bacterium]MDP5095032.1 substrate-binding domain-containing protein [Candidatus Nanopelagicales bacterium]